jgi:hypothetical protein
MKILVVGCSFSSGWGFVGEKDNPSIWPNLIDADVANMSETGTDNTGIFLNTLTADPKQYDRVVVQWTGMDRVVLGHGMITQQNPVPNLLTDSDYEHFYKSFLLLNTRLHHWSRFCQMISCLQTYQNVYFVNGLLDWDKNVFDPTMTWDRITKNKFLSSIVDVEHATDQQIQHTWNIIKLQLNDIDLSKWVNPFNSLQSMRIDQVSVTDQHPGALSHQKYAELIYNSIPV